MTRAYRIYSAPATEPITLAEARTHVRAASGAFADNVSVNQSIAPGAHVTAASYSLKGTGVDVSAATSAIVVLESGTNGAGGTVDVKLQESDTDSDAAYADVTSGAFTQVTTANDNATYEKSYTGTKKYLRVVSTVANATCEFGVSIVLDSPSNADDTYLTSLITVARRWCEDYQNRACITQTWDLYLDEFPAEDYIEVPMPPLASVTTLKYKDTAGTLQTWAATNYVVDTMSEPGRIALAYGVSWPSTYDEIQAVQIRFVCGAATVDMRVKQALLLLVGHWYANREAVLTGSISKQLEFAVNAMLDQERIIPI